MTDGSQVRPRKKTVAVWNLPILYSVGDVEEEPNDQYDDHDPGQDLGSPLDDLGMPPEWDTLVSQTLTYCQHTVLRESLKSCRWSEA